MRAARMHDVGRLRERRRRRRVARLAVVVAAAVAWPLLRWATGHPLGLPQLPHFDPLYLMSGLFFLVLIVTMVGTTVVSGRSPHIVYRPEQIDVRMDDVKGLAPVTEEVRRSIDLLLAGPTFRREMGGTPRRGLLFEGAPGTGKTHLAKAMAAEAGVPFLFVSATSFQSSYYGATARKIRSYFRALRKAARAEGAAIGFIEEIDAIGTVRGALSAVPAPALRSASAVHCGGLVGLPSVGLDAAAPGSLSGGGPGTLVHRASAVSEGVGGVVNELLVQLQSFDAPTPWQRVQGTVIDAVNLLLPAHRTLPRPRPEPVDVLIIAATNRADSLDPGLLRPGRFDRRLVFSEPDKAGRRELIDHFLGRKSHDEQLAGDAHRDALAGITQGYTPVMIEHLLDEALVNAVRRGAPGMSWADVEHARLVTEVGLGQPVGYTAYEERLIATHEAGHAVIASLVAPTRRLEVLTIVKRAGSLGLLAHGDTEDVYTRSQHELEGLIQIAFGGQVAEELFFGDISTGPGGDLAYATELAAQMVGASGMAGTLVSFAAGGGGALDGDLVSRVLGDERGRRQVEELLGRQQVAARQLLAGNRDLVEALRDALLQRHELIGPEITDVLRTAESARRTGRRESGGSGA
jgi:cell division protease FtsH